MTDRARAGATILVLVFVLTACSGGREADEAGKAGNAGNAGNAGKAVKVGEGVDLEAIDDGARASPSTSASAEVTTAVTGTTTAAARTTPEVANRTVRDHSSGLRLTLVVGDKLAFEADEFVEFELAFENVSDRTLFHDSNQRWTFVLQPEDSGSARSGWTDDACRSEPKSTPPMTGVLELGPGELGSFQATYPAHRSASHAGADVDACRVLPGEYLVAGKVDWCPEDGIRRSDTYNKPYCDADAVVAVWAAPLRVTIG